MQESDAASWQKRQLGEETTKGWRFLSLFSATCFTALTNKLMDTVLHRHDADQQVGWLAGATVQDRH